MELGEAEAVGMLDHHDGRVRNVDADFNHRGRDQHVDFAFLEFPHDMFFFFGIEPSMQQADVKIGKSLVA